MEIRRAIPGDTPAIVNLLRESLGDSRLPKSERSWRWKHMDNVFGPSYVLLAVQNEVIVGVRPFMRWNWQQGGRTVSAVRAVDTATSPLHQGKGIFSKLTGKLVEECAADGVTFIFNTPNEKSMPGYLKLGWRSLGKLAICIRPRLPGRKKIDDFDSMYELPLNFPAFESRVSPDQLTTLLTPSYLQWRYVQNPFARYHFVKTDTCWIIFRLKVHRFGTELRVCEVIGDATRASVRDALHTAARDAGAVFISFSPNQLSVLAAKGHWGPHVTVRELVGENLLNFNHWKPTIGDLELF